MGDVIGTLAVVVIYLVIVMAGLKRKTRRKAKEKSEQARTVSPGDFKMAFPKETRRAQESPQRMVTQLQMELAGEGEDPCHEGPGIHLHSVSQQVMQAAGEGEDPCHAGGVSGVGEPSPVYDSPITGGESAQSDALARRVLDGVIMSEILTRPCERRAGQRKIRRKA